MIIKWNDNLERGISSVEWRWVNKIIHVALKSEGELLGNKG